MIPLHCEVCLSFFPVSSFAGETLSVMQAWLIQREHKIKRQLN